MPGHIQRFRAASRKPATVTFRDDIGIFASDLGYATLKSRATRDAAGRETIGEHCAKQMTLVDIFATIKIVGERIEALELKRAARQQPAQPQRTQDSGPCLCGATPCRCASSAPKAPIKDIAMRKNFHLAPRPYVTFPKSSSDQQRFGEPALSRFSSQEADRLARNAPGAAGPPSAEEMNAAHAAYSARDNKLREAKQQYNVQGGTVESSILDDSSESFATKLHQIPSGQPNRALNAFNKRWHAIKSPAARDSVEKIWRDFSATYDARERP